MNCCVQPWIKRSQVVSVVASVYYSTVRMRDIDTRPGSHSQFEISRTHLHCDALLIIQLMRREQ
jgi:hypothetical protein